MDAICNPTKEKLRNLFHNDEHKLRKITGLLSPESQRKLLENFKNDPFYQRVCECHISILQWRDHEWEVTDLD